MHSSISDHLTNQGLLFISSGEENTHTSKETGVDGRWVGVGGWMDGQPEERRVREMERVRDGGGKAIEEADLRACLCVCVCV